jgi:hypothetical protein
MYTSRRYRRNSCGRQAYSDVHWGVILYRRVVYNGVHPGPILYGCVAYSGVHPGAPLYGRVAYSGVHPCQKFIASAHKCTCVQRAFCIMPAPSLDARLYPPKSRCTLMYTGHHHQRNSCGRQAYSDVHSGAILYRRVAYNGVHPGAILYRRVACNGVHPFLLLGLTIREPVEMCETTE